MELYPGFSLYRGLYEFSEYVSQGRRDGMKWKDFSSSGMDEVFYIIIVEWFLALIAAYYLDQGSLSAKDSFLFLKNALKKSRLIQRPSLRKQGSAVSTQMEKLDVIQEV